MKTGSHIIYIILSALIFNCCNQQMDNHILKNAEYDLQIHTLIVDYQKYPDTSLLQIIFRAFSFPFIRRLTAAKSFLSE